MKGYRFYLEYPHGSKRRGQHTGNVLALTLNDNGHPNYSASSLSGTVLECVAGVYHHPNSDVCLCTCDEEYLRDNGKRISEAKAREIHPALFAVLDSWEEADNDH